MWSPFVHYTAVAVALVVAGAGQAQEKHWAFQPLVRPAVPAVKNSAAVRTAVDAFIVAKLEGRGLALSAEADARTLLRRVYLDLIGLPPSPEEVEAFVAKPQAALEAVIDGLLASPQFGERWGRHWLDAAGYADVTGTDNDAAIIRQAENRWRYRDHVIRAHNEDRPFRRFLTEQLAGDELIDWREADTITPPMRELLTATGFLRTAADDTDENELNTQDIRHGVLHRTMETVATNVLALTLGCAKCHDHKYEPITQRDFYRFQALFQPALNPHNWKQPKDRQLAIAGKTERAEGDMLNAELDKQIAELNKRKAAAKDKDKGEIDREIAKLNGQRRRWEHLQAAYDVGPPTPTHLLKRGNHERPGAEVAPGFFTALATPGDEQRLTTVKPAGKTSGRRLALAAWLTDTKTPAGSLVLRVRVNRVWQQLFGRGIVQSSDNFGVTGTPPTHPELLDWLAAEYDANGQRLKPLLRLLMTSAVYRQASAGQGAAPTADPDNRLLWRMPLRRLDAEVIRDSILCVSGKLDPSAGGPPVAVEPRPDGTFVGKGAVNRRSVYLLARRNYHESFLNAFDSPNLTASCVQRTPAVVVSQALTLLNAPFMREQSGALAERVAKSDDRIGRTFLLVLCRPPTEREVTLCRELLDRQAAHYRAAGNADADRRAMGHLCHMLLNTSEFLYAP